MKRVASAALLALAACRAPEPPGPAREALERLGLEALPLEAVAAGDDANAKLAPSLRNGLFPRVRKDEPIPLCLDLGRRADLAALGRALDAARVPRRERAELLLDLLEAEREAQRPFVDWLLAQPGVGELESYPALARLCFVGSERIALAAAARNETAWIQHAPRVPAVRAPEPLRPPEPIASPEGWARRMLGADAPGVRELDGRGVVVAILDSGIDESHPAVAGRKNGSFSPAVDAPSHRAHGLQVLAAAVGAGGLGLAPGARWVSADPIGADVLDPRAFGAAVDWLLREARPDVVVAPWDAPPPAALGPGLARAFGLLRTAGAACVFPAGNTGPAPGENRPPANLPALAPDGAPAFSVGGLRRDGGVYPPSNRGPNEWDGSPFPQVAAPADGLELADPSRRSPAVRGEGTSFAAGHAAGALALVLQARPELTGPEAEALLRETAADLGEPGPDSTFGRGRIDLASALAAR